MSPTLKAFILGLFVSIIVLFSFLGGAIADRVFVIKPLDSFLKRRAIVGIPETSDPGSASVSNALNSNGSVSDIAEQASKSVVSISIKQPAQSNITFSPFGVFGQQVPAPNTSDPAEPITQDIGTGFVADAQGLIVTNRHVVGQANAEYFVIDQNDKEYQVTNIYRDPTNDIAILKVEGAQLPAITLGDSDQIKVGQAVVAIGTALGEFRHTVTTGVVSGLGRGITAGDPFSRSIESLENVIQTDAAINPGNSGGPLLDSAGSVIGVNVAVSQSAQNVGFAIPINTIKASIENFNQTGQFNRPFMGVQYQGITEAAALANEVPQGAYLRAVVANGSAAGAGLQVGDILTEFDGHSLKDHDLIQLINAKKISDQVTVKYWRNGQERSVDVTLKGTEQ